MALTQELKKELTNIIRFQVSEIKKSLLQQYWKITKEVREFKQTAIQLKFKKIQTVKGDCDLLVKIKDLLLDPLTWRQIRSYQKDRNIKSIRQDEQSIQGTPTFNDEDEAKQRKQQFGFEGLLPDNKKSINQRICENKPNQTYNIRPNKLTMQKRQSFLLQEQSTSNEQKIQRSRTPETPRFNCKEPVKIQESMEKKDYQNIESLVLSNSPLLEQSHKKSIQKKLIQSEVKNYTGKSELLYKFSDKSFNKNIHHYIDNKRNILLVIKLKNKKVLSAFTEIPFKKRNIPENNPRAFIADLIRDKYYIPKNSCKTICFDENFLLFGNSQIRLKNKDYKMYSNFGITKGFFGSDGDTIGQFIGTQNLLSPRQSQFIDYEIYHLY